MAAKFGYWVTNMLQIKFAQQLHFTQAETQMMDTWQANKSPYDF